MLKTKLKIRVFGDDVLRGKARRVQEVGVPERMLIASMIKTMHAEDGVGLAAPQVGVDQQIFVVDVGDGPFAVINPRIIKKKGTEVMEEGCLSVPGIMVNVKRPKEISVKYIDENNEVVQKTLTDLPARVFLHENDHLIGKLIVDYSNVVQKIKMRKKLKELEKQSRIL